MSDFILLILWGIIGVQTLIHGEISRLSYGLVWGLYMIDMALWAIERKVKKNGRKHDSDMGKTKSDD